MFENLKRLYESHKITAKGIQAARERGWITQAEAQKIMNGKAAPEPGA